AIPRGSRFRQSVAVGSLLRFQLFRLGKRPAPGYRQWEHRRAQRDLPADVWKQAFRTSIALPLPTTGEDIAAGTRRLEPESKRAEFYSALSSIIRVQDFRASLIASSSSGSFMTPP